MKRKFISVLILTVILQGFFVNAQTVSTSDELFEAIANATDGTTIKLEAKTYKIDEAIVIDGIDALTIDGGGATIILNSTEENVFTITNSVNFTLKNIKAKHTDPSGPLGCLGNVVFIDNCPGATFKNCDLNGSGIVGIAAYNCDALQVLNCYIHKNSQYGIIYQGSDLLVKKTTFENNGNDNVIYYSYVDPGKYGGWPPEEKIKENVTRQHLVLKKNIFK